MDENTLDEEHSWSGQWWLPENPDEKVSGVLTFGPDDGLTLTLIGGWEYQALQHPSPAGVDVSGGLHSWGMIHGHAQNKALTLLDASVKRARTFDMVRIFSGGPDELVLRAQTLLVGCLLESPDEPAFEAAIAAAENLTSWSRQGGITTKWMTNPDSGAQAREVSSVTVPTLSVEVGELTAELHTVAWAPAASLQRWGRSAEIRERSTFEFTSATPLGIRECIRLMGTIEDLLSLSTLRACALIWMRVYLPARPERWPEDHPQRNQRHEVEVYQQRIARPHPQEKAVDARDFILTPKDVAFEALIPRWLKVDAKFSAARSMVLGLRYITDGYLESKVVTAVAAAESMSRALKPAPVMTKRELRELRAKVLAVVPADQQPWVSERFASAEPTLKERLKVLARRPGDFMSALVPDVDAWAASAANARNKLAHVGQSSHNAAELYAVVEVTSAVVIMNFMFELGVSADRMRTAISEHRRLAAAAQMARTVFPGTPCHDSYRSTESVDE